MSWLGFAIEGVVKFFKVGDEEVAPTFQAPFPSPST
jgi:hypothetical protein